MRGRITRFALLAGLVGVTLPLYAQEPAPPRSGWSPEYQAGLKRTLELRRQRRRAGVARPAVGRIVPYPMPPSLIIRQTPEVHDEIGGLLRVLRGGP